MDDRLIAGRAAGLAGDGSVRLLRPDRGGAAGRVLAAVPGFADVSECGVTVVELKRAWRAIRDGRFGGGTGRGVWSPGGPVLPVLGAHGSSGATTLALALATGAAPARVVECAPLLSSGLVGAANAELGACGEGGWLRGSRGEVLVERVGFQVSCALDVPVPAVPVGEVSLTVVDAFWDPAGLLGAEAQGWLSGLLRGASCVVVTAVATVPGLRRLETGLGLLVGRPVVAGVLGPVVRRWPRVVAGSVGPLTRRLLSEGRVVPVRELAGLRAAGVASDRLPAALVAAAGEVLRLVGDLTTSIPDDVED